MAARDITGLSRGPKAGPARAKRYRIGAAVLRRSRQLLTRGALTICASDFQRPPRSLKDLHPERADGRTVRRSSPTFVTNGGSQGEGGNGDAGTANVTSDSPNREGYRASALMSHLLTTLLPGWNPYEEEEAL